MRPNARNKTLSPRGGKKPKDREQQMLLQGLLQDGNLDSISSNSLKLDEDSRNPYKDLDNLDVRFSRLLHHIRNSATRILYARRQPSTIAFRGKVRGNYATTVHLQARQTRLACHVPCTGASHDTVHRCCTSPHSDRGGGCLLTMACHISANRPFLWPALRARNAR